jgi:multidrug efflux pump
VLLRTVTGMKPLVHHGSGSSVAPVQSLGHEAGH